MHWVMLPTASCRSSGFIRDACRQAFEEPFNYLSQSSVVSSVRDTLRLLNVGLTWGTRQHGIARLPRPIQELIVWNHALDDTNCMIQPDLVPPKSVARASADNVSDAARAVIVRCVLSRRIGGVALNIGTLPSEYSWQIERPAVAGPGAINSALQTNLRFRRR